MREKTDNLPFLQGDITQKGYEKKRQRLLAPYTNLTKSGSHLTSATAQGKIFEIIG